MRDFYKLYCAAQKKRIIGCCRLWSTVCEKDEKRDGFSLDDDTMIGVDINEKFVIEYIQDFDTMNEVGNTNKESALEFTEEPINFGSQNWLLCVAF